MQQNNILLKVIQILRKDLQYLVDNTNVSDRFIKKQNHILELLTTYYNETTLQIEFLSNEIATIRQEKRIAIQKSEDKIFSLEATCIMHGILDFPMWVNLGKVILNFKTKNLYDSGKMLLPTVFKNKLEKLTPEERAILEAILFKENKETIETYTKRLQQIMQQNNQQNDTI